MSKYLNRCMLFVVFGLVGCCFAVECDWSKFPMQGGAFDSSWESLEKYEVPEWFCDAKLGIWAIIGPQCVPMQGDWYARNMYIEGHRQYEYHVKHYGHPSEFGYKDIIKLFNPEKLDYDKLLELYKEAGAKYAVILAVHHDNFDLWDSRYHEWNSVKMNPHRDLVGEFRDAAKKQGLRFGVTTHLARSYSWMQTNKGADKKGPKAGIPYDGNDPKYQTLYHPPFQEYSRYPQNPPESWQLEWYLRVKDLIDSYQPDLMYFDGGYPFDDGMAGRRLVADYYNANASWHHGSNEAAMCVKNIGIGVFREGTCVLDIERGRTEEMQANVWQTDTCIGQWYYREGVTYKSVGEVVQTLIDIVSKNGNLLLNIPIRPDGSIDEREEAILKGIGKWMAVNGEGIYNTRPWLVCGEGETKIKGGHMKEQKTNYMSSDIRFTCKGDSDLYAFFMAWPENNEILIESLAKPLSAAATIQSVTMVGAQGELKYEQTDEGLKIHVPDSKPCEHAWAIHIQGSNLKQINVSKLDNK